jgi:sigma-E factor negative regulatory protein RseA
MTDRLKESISALMDGEADELELRRVLRETDASVNSTWQRYHLIRDVLTQQAAPQQSSIAVRVSQAIAEESVNIEEPVTSSSWIKSMTGLAVAASVAFAVVFSVRAINPVDGVGVLPSQSTAPAVASRVFPVNNAGSLNASFGKPDSNRAQIAESLVSTEQAGSAAKETDVVIKARFDQYILRHTESAALNNRQGMISFARVVNFKPQEQ